MLVLRNCRLIKGLVEDFNEEMADIVIEDDKIVNILPCNNLLHQESQVLDMEGKFVLPGLMDIHVHLTLSAGDVMVDCAKSKIKQALDGLKFAQDTLEAGFTTIRDVGASNKVAIEIRDSINSNMLIGPNIIACGRIITPTENGNDFFKGLYLETDKPDDMIKSVRQCMKEGADFIKLMGSGSVMNPGGIPGQTICTEEEYESIVKAATFKNTYVAVHCHGTEAMKSAIRAGVRTIEHASLLDDECIELLEKSNSFIVPTLSAAEALMSSLPESSIFMKEKAEAVKKGIVDGVKKAYEKGLIIGLGTDQGITGLYHGDNARELELRKEWLGMEEIDIIKQATINNAIIMNKEDELGTIKVGKIADIIAVEGNPLMDISVIRNNVVKVIKSGKIII